METLLTWLAVMLAGLLVSARTHITVTAPVHASIPVLGVVALALLLAVAAVFAAVARLLLRDGLRLRPRMVTL